MAGTTFSWSSTPPIYEKSFVLSISCRATGGIRATIFADACPGADGKQKGRKPSIDRSAVLQRAEWRCCRRAALAEQAGEKGLKNGRFVLLVGPDAIHNCPLRERG